MNELTLVLHFTTLIATKTDLREYMYNKLELPSMSIAQDWQLQVHRAHYYGR